MDKNEILIVHGNEAADMAGRICEAADVAALVGGRNARVGIKPNLVLASVAERGATTHPGLVRGVVRYLKQCGIHNIRILEGAWVGAHTRRAFDVCGYSALAAEYGLELVDTKRDEAVACDCEGMQIDICKSVFDIDFMINMPVMKGHCQTAVTCALKNGKGLIPDAEKRRFHRLGLHKPIAHLNTRLKNDFVIVDAICGDLDFEEGGNPVVGNRAFAMRDAVLCDAFVAAQMGYALKEVPYIGMAEALGVGSARAGAAKLTALNAGVESGGAPKPTGKARRLAGHICEEGACSACAAALTRALSRMSANQLAALPGPVCIGQGFKGRGGRLGVGSCTARFERTVHGCPPAADEILLELRRM